LQTSQSRGRGLPALAAALPLMIIGINVLSIILTAARDMALSAAQTTTWILALYGLSGVVALAITMLYRQPLLFTGNLFVLVFVASLGGELSYPMLIGATVVAGVVVTALGALGLTGWLAYWIPAPVVLGLLAGALMPFVSDIFTSLGQAPVLVGGTFLTYVLGRLTLRGRLPALLPALVTGVALTALTGQFGPLSAPLALPVPVITPPQFSPGAILTAAPVIVVLMTLQANLPSMVYMQNEGFDPPDRVVNTVSGIGTLLASLLGPTALSISLPATALLAGPKAGELPERYRSAIIASGFGVLIGLLAAIAAALNGAIPAPLLLALAGLAVFDVLASALVQIVRGPLLLGPLFALASALSEISFLGFGPFFWALVIGTGVSLLLERDGIRELRGRLD
jgi:benzoate membrane transport protein